MTYYEAPTYYSPPAVPSPAIFLAGGITGCPPWQQEAREIIEELAPDVVILNPARENFPIDDPSAGWEQVTWEQHHLHLPGVLTIFWFPACDRRVTTQPIAMFELGQALGEGRGLVVGADPGYPRAADVHMLCELARPGIRVHDTLTSTVESALEETPHA